MIQQAVLQKRNGTASLDDCSIAETCCKLFTLLYVVQFWYVWEEVSYMVFPPAPAVYDQCRQ